MAPLLGKKPGSERLFNALGVLSTVCEMDPQAWAHLQPLYPDVIFTDAVEEVFAIERIAGVAVATRAATRAELVQRALLAGKDVLSRKAFVPLGRRSAET